MIVFYWYFILCIFYLAIWNRLSVFTMISYDTQLCWCVCVLYIPRYSWKIRFFFFTEFCKNPWIQKRRRMVSRDSEPHIFRYQGPTLYLTEFLVYTAVCMILQVLSTPDRIFCVGLFFVESFFLWSIFQKHAAWKTSCVLLCKIALHKNSPLYFKNTLRAAL